MQQLEAISSSRSVTQWLAVPRRGRVLATFSRSCYLDIAGKIIAIVSSDLLNGPLNIVVNADGNVAFDRIPVGMTIHASEHRIHSENGPMIDTAHASIWDPRLPRWTEEDWVGVRASVPLVATQLVSEAPEGSFAHYLRDAETVAPRAPRAQRALSLLKDGLKQRSIDILTESAGGLAGLGGGLTPSGDDVLVGTLVALTVCPEDGHQGFREAILGATRGRTNRISEAYLEAASLGEAGEAWHRFTRVLPGFDQAAIASAARRVMAFGETSGSDMLAGFALATSTLIS